PGTGILTPPRAMDGPFPHPEPETRHDDPDPDPGRTQQPPLHQPPRQPTGPDRAGRPGHHRPPDPAAAQRDGDRPDRGRVGPWGPTGLDEIPRMLRRGPPGPDVVSGLTHPRPRTAHPPTPSTRT